MKKKATTKQSETDWERIDLMTDDDIDFSDNPETTPEMWANGIVRKGFKPIGKKKQVTLRIDNDVLEFFRSQGKGYQTRINQLLRAYMEEVKKTA